MDNSLTIFLLINSLLIIGLITIQNESKDTNTQRSTTSSTSPLEILTWIAILLEIILLLLKLKLNEI